MEQFRKAMVDLPWIVKLLLVVFYDIYGALKRISKGDVKGIVVGVLMLVTGNFFGIMWVVDLITVIVKKHSFFERDGYNIYCDIPLTIAEATLGAEIDVPTLEGNQKFTIPEGTQGGTEFTLRQKGIPYVNNANRRGDLIFTTVIEIPRGLNEKQKAHMRDFAESCKESNYTKKNSFFKRIFDKK